jgi:polyadenylate-binding protein
MEINPLTYNPENPISIYVGDLDKNCDYLKLETIFKQFYSTVVGSKIIKDPSTRQSKGYGFVMFGSPEEADLAIDEMHGFQIMSRKIRTGKSMSKNGMAPIRGSGNGSGIVGNGISSMQMQGNLGNVPPQAPGTDVAPGQQQMRNMGYPGMMMFNSMGYPVSYSQYYNFNMINMPYSYGQSGEMIQGGGANPQNMQKINEKSDMGDSQKGMNTNPNNPGFPNPYMNHQNQGMPNEMMNNPYYAQGYQMYGVNPGMYMNANQNLQGMNQRDEHNQVVDGQKQLLGKRSSEAFKNENSAKVDKLNYLPSANKETIIKEESEEVQTKEKQQVYGWFEKKTENKNEKKENSLYLDELITKKFDWFTSSENSINKFVTDFFEV